MILTINGKTETHSNPVKLSTIIEKSNINPDRVIIQVNNDILGRESFNSFILEKDSTIEIMAIVGGG